MAEGTSRVELIDLLNELSSVADKYYFIGIQLHIKKEIIKQIENDHKDTTRRFSEVLSYWLDNGENVTWDAVIAALKSPSVGHKTLATTLREKYIKSTTQDICQPSLVHSDSGYVSQPLLESQQSTTTAAGYAMSQPLLESQQSDDCEDAETIDYKSPASTPPPQPSVKPLFPLVDGHVTTDTPKKVFDTLNMFGYTEFQPGQEKAIVNVLSGISTLVILPIGSGKSLIYQLPAYLYSQSRAPESPCITLVVSPLISLMEDQISNFPTKLNLKGACLHHTQSEDRKNEILRNAVEGRINVLLLSPETLVGGSLWSGRGTSYSLSRLPPVAFACVDEVHCVSEWSHSFRPSYFCIDKILRERLGVHCVLGLTATATHTTALSVADHLGIDQKYIIREGTIIPDHLNISVTCVENKDKALIDLLQSPNFKDCKSIIVYCTRQQTTKHVAELLNKHLPCSQSDKSENDRYQESISLQNKNKKRQKITTSTPSSSKRRKTESTRPKIARFYHSRVLASERDEIQKNFMDGRLRIIVATVAFGMGLNKRDIRAIIHYDIPKSFESFVQEIGRAGRDKKPAYCHVFVHKYKRDVYDLRTFAYGNTVDQATVAKLLNEAFPECQCSVAEDIQNQSSDTSSTHSSINVSSSTMPVPSCKGHEVAIPIEEMTQSLDMYEENISTLLCYLELQSHLKLMGTIKDSCILTWDGRQRELRSLKRKAPILIGAAIEFNRNDDTTENEIEFSLVKVANSMEQEVRSVCSQLYQLKEDKKLESVEFSDNAFHIQTHGNFTAEDRYSIRDHLCKKMKEQERKQLEKLHLIHAALSSESPNSPFDGVASMNDQAAARPNLRSMTEQYFSNGGLDRAYLEKHKIPVLLLTEEITPEEEERVKGLIQAFRRKFSKEVFTGRSIARIFHGIQSPRYPAITWGCNNTYWRSHNAINFNTLCEIATKIVDND